VAEGGNADQATTKENQKMKPIFLHLTVVAFLLCPTCDLGAQPMPRPYRLNAVDLKRPVIWGAESRQPTGHGLAFGGQDQDANDGRPHTRVLADGKWKAIHRELRAANSLQKHYTGIWALRQAVKAMLARARFVYFQGLTPKGESKLLERDVEPRLSRIAKQLAAGLAALPGELTDKYARDQVRLAREYLQRARKQLPSLKNGVDATALRSLHRAQIELELAAEALDAEPPPRAMNCGTARLSSRKSGPAGNTLVYDSSTKLYVFFGGDHLDYLTNDTWVFDPRRRRWFQRHPRAAPPPRANHRLRADGDGKVRMTGGYSYSSSTGYVSGQYVDLNDGEWTYNLRTNTWSGGKLVAPDSRTYRTGPFHPNYFLTGPKPDAAKFAARLDKIPVNEWVPTNPPRLPRLNRDWGTARIDPDHDVILRWSGGHSAHGGTDVLHYHFSTNRWELPFPVEFPLGQLYSNTSYPNGFNFNLRPWMTGHTYQNYEYDPPGRTMIKAGRPRHFYVYDPVVADWIGRGNKPKAMQYNSCFYTLTLTATPKGVVCWDRNGRVHRYEHRRGRWTELKLAGDKLPGAYVDRSTIAYDSKRDRVLMINTSNPNRFDGSIWSLDLKSHGVKRLLPEGRQQAHRFANVDKCCYDAANDLLLIGTYLKGAGDHTPTPAYDCRNNRWITLNIRYSTGNRYGRTTRAFPHARSDGLVFDARRKLIWGTDTNSRIYVLRLKPKQADLKVLK
jgi:hypothetical protein